jgi:hypothetical protein
MVAIVGGSKVSTKLTVLDSLSKIADQLIVGGGIANTFVAAQGHNVGKSLYEADLVDEAKRLLTTCDIPVPTDVRVATEFSETATATLKSVNDIKDDEQILDLGDVSAQKLADILKNAKTILWNGPVGVFEFPNFRKGTEIVANAIADSEGFSIAGGGDTLAAIDLFGISDKISYISTGGGAFLEFVEGKVLPAVAMLEERAKNLFRRGNPPVFQRALKAATNLLQRSKIQIQDYSNMSKIFDFVKPGVITGDDVQKVFQVAKENNFALPAVNCVGTDSINAVLEAAAKFVLRLSFSSPTAALRLSRVKA